MKKRRSNKKCVFNVGDIVKTIDNDELVAEVGACGKVTGVKKEDSVDYLNIAWIRNGKDRNQCDGGYYPHHFIKVNNRNMGRFITPPFCGKCSICKQLIVVCDSCGEDFCNRDIVYCTEDSLGRKRHECLSCRG